MTQNGLAAAVAVRGHATGRAVHRRLRRLNEDGGQINVVVKRSTRDIQPIKAKPEVAAGAVVGARMATRSRALQARTTSSYSERMLGGDGS